ncbi:hypothetical protein Pyn_24574 [Prunus yedoensis var. nudiflora]|uniref:Uncharacterized protein n=1 Tax=Prunus yedoensis var. nudiflora TaxID=2094558 RepID=A0A314UU76_PRUYE|nr:hypothetical protein Pyn_24574 [Prunus yedoensis var. nudiflora]
MTNLHFSAIQSDWISSIVVGGSLLLVEVERVDGDVAGGALIEDEGMIEVGKVASAATSVADGASYIVKILAMSRQSPQYK